MEEEGHMEETRRLVRVFGTQPGTGSVAGVVVGAVMPDSRERSLVAAELGVPTTVFIAVTDVARAGVQVRFHSPVREMNACGYATIAAGLVMRAEQMWVGSSPLRVYGPTASYELTAAVSQVGLAIPVRSERRVAASEASRLAPYLGGLANPVDCRAADTGLKHLLVRVGSLPALNSLRPDRATAVAMASVGDFDTIGYYAFGDDGVVHVRDICAPVGDLEEPASGTTCAALAAALTTSGECSTHRFLQGEAMGSPSLLNVSIDRNRCARVSSGGVITAP